MALADHRAATFGRRTFLGGLAAAAVAGPATIFPSPARAVFEERFGETLMKKIKVGVVVTSTGLTTGIVATSAVPMDWPEQSVQELGVDKSANAKLTFRTLENGVKQMVVTAPKLGPGDELKCIVTYEVTKRVQEEPSGVEELVVPAKLPRELSKFLLPSPFIESTDAKIVAQAPKLIAGRETAWEKVGAIFDWVRENVKYQFAEAIKPATAALRDGVGDCEELSSLFIAFCRVNKIPARAVWVPGHTYPEFYLEDAAGLGHWIPCQAAGAGRDFGRMKESRPILQKGDNFKLPEEKLPQRYVKQFLKAANVQGDLQYQFIMEPVKGG